MGLARQEDTTATLSCCEEAEPVINSICSVPLFANVFGKDETRSIVSLALIEFIMSFPCGTVTDRDMPHLIKRVLTNELYDKARRLKYRKEMEQQENPCYDTDPSPHEAAATEPRAAASTEPETSLLQQELVCDVQDALQQLNPQEQAVIRGLFWQQKTTTQLAQELHYSVRNIRKLRSKALARLRDSLQQLAE